MVLIFFQRTNEHIFMCLNYSLSSSVICVLMSLAHISIIVAFPLLIFIHDGYCIFVGLHALHISFPSLWQLSLLYDPF